MKKIIAIVLLAASLAVPAQAVIIGASVGYLTDGEDAYLAARAGTEFSSTNSLAHIGEIEIGYTSDSESGLEGSFMPVTVNYRAQFVGNGKLGGYVGFGAGMARTKVSGFGLSESDWAFAVQGFVGVSFKVSPTASLDLGARYIWLDKVTLFGTDVELGDDLVIEAGFHIRF